jgi:uncharacterized protein (TIGR00730 family)
MASICVFCGSSSGRRPEYARAAEELGHELAKRDISLVYGGAKVGLMGIVANAALEAGGRVIGVIPGALVEKEVAHPGLTELRKVNSMHERKAVMADLSDAFIAMPGGFGTLDEFCEVLTWSQLGLHKKNCGVLNVCGYFDPLLALFDRAVAEGLLKASNRELVHSSEDPIRLVEVLLSAQPSVEDKWIGREQG